MHTECKVGGTTAHNRKYNNVSSNFVLADEGKTINFSINLEFRIFWFFFEATEKVIAPFII